MHRLYYFVNHPFCVHIIFYSLRFLQCISCGVCVDSCMRKISIKIAKTTGSLKKMHYVNLVHQAYINAWASQMQCFADSIPNVISCTRFWDPRLKIFRLAIWNLYFWNLLLKTSNICIRIYVSPFLVP